MTNKPDKHAKSRRPGAWRRGSCTAAPCAPSSARPRRRCSSPRATSTSPPSRPRSASRARPGFIYCRYANPTVAMFEERMRLLEGAAGRARHRHRHGRRHLRAAVLPQGRRPHRRRARPVRLLPLRGRGPVSALRHRLARWSTAATSTPGSAPCAPTPRRSSSRRRPTRRSISSTSPPSPRSRTRPARWSSSTTCSPRPLLQKPLKLGADVVVYSATKHIDGQGRCLGGVVLGSQASVKDHLHNFLRRPGPSLSPFNAWVMLKGLETLPLRVRAQCEARGQASPTTWPRRRASPACSTAAAPTTRRRRSPSGRCRASARS